MEDKTFRDFFRNVSLADAQGKSDDTKDSAQVSKVVYTQLCEYEYPDLTTEQVHEFVQFLAEHLKTGRLPDASWFKLSHRFYSALAAHLTRQQEDFISKRAAGMTTDSRFWLALSELSCLTFITALPFLLKPSESGYTGFLQDSPAQAALAPDVASSSAVPSFEFAEEAKGDTAVDLDPDDYVFDADKSDSDTEQGSAAVTASSIKAADETHAVPDTPAQAASKVLLVIAMWGNIDWFSAHSAAQSESSTTLNSSHFWFARHNVLQTLTELTSAPTLCDAKHTVASAALTLCTAVVNTFPEAVELVWPGLPAILSALGAGDTEQMSALTLLSEACCASASATVFKLATINSEYAHIVSLLKTLSDPLVQSATPLPDTVSALRSLLRLIWFAVHFAIPSAPSTPSSAVARSAPRPAAQEVITRPLDAELEHENGSGSAQPAARGMRLGPRTITREARQVPSSAPASHARKIAADSSAYDLWSTRVTQEILPLLFPLCAAASVSRGAVELVFDFVLASAAVFPASANACIAAADVLMCPQPSSMPSQLLLPLALALSASNVDGSADNSAALALLLQSSSVALRSHISASALSARAASDLDQVSDASSAVFQRQASLSVLGAIAALLANWSAPVTPVAHKASAFDARALRAYRFAFSMSCPDAFRLRLLEAVRSSAASLDDSSSAASLIQALTVPALVAEFLSHFRTIQSDGKAYLKSHSHSPQQGQPQQQQAVSASADDAQPSGSPVAASASAASSASASTSASASASTTDTAARPQKVVVTAADGSAPEDWRDDWPDSSDDESSTAAALHDGKDKPIELLSQPRLPDASAKMAPSDDSNDRITPLVSALVVSLLAVFPSVVKKD